MLGESKAIWRVSEITMFWRDLIFYVIFLSSKCMFGALHVGCDAWCHCNKCTIYILCISQRWNERLEGRKYRFLLFCSFFFKKEQVFLFFIVENKKGNLVDEGMCKVHKWHTHGHILIKRKRFYHNNLLHLPIHNCCR